MNSRSPAERVSTARGAGGAGAGAARAGEAGAGAARGVRTGVAAGAAGGVRTGVVACGALAVHIGEITSRRRWPVDVHPLPPLLHNRPEQIAGEVERLVTELRPRYGERLAVAYADCGTYGALDASCERLSLRRLGGKHCYDVFAGTDVVGALLEEEPGTYLLTDFLVRSFERSVVVELGLDRWPELRADYFGGYRRVVWLSQSPTPELHQAAARAAAVLGLPLEHRPVGDGGLERELAALVGAA